jgi:hypothetical protein
MTFHTATGPDHGRSIARRLPGACLSATAFLATALLAGGCCDQGPDSLADLLNPAADAWGHSVQDVGRTLCRRAGDRETSLRAARTIEGIGRGIKSADAAMTDALLDALAGPPAEYPETDPPCDPLVEDILGERMWFPRRSWRTNPGNARRRLHD